MRQTTAIDMGVSRRPVDRPLYVRLQHLLGRDWHVAYVFVLPTLLLLGGLIAYPFVNAVYLSFTNTVTLQTGPFVGLRNYRVLWQDPFFRGAVWNTVVYTLTSVFFKFWLGLLAALLIHRATRFSGILTGAVLVPWIVPSVVIALTWKSLLDPVYGGVNQFLIQTGMVEKGFPWFGSTQTAMASLIMVNVWQGIPFYAINLLAGLKAIDKEYYEAAKIDGASPWRCFRHITLPGLRYVLIVCVLLSTIWTFNGFTEIYLLTGGGPVGATRVYSILAWEYAIQSLRIGVGVAAAITMAPILAIFIYILGRYMSAGGRVEESSSVDTQHNPIAQLFGVLAWPFKMLIKLFLWLVDVVNDAVEFVIESIGSAIQRVFVGDSPAAKRRGLYTGKFIGGFFAGLVLFLLLAFELVPFYWVIITAFKPTSQIVAFKSVFWPEPWTMEQFNTLLGPTRDFIVWYRNTVTVAAVTTVVSVLVAALGAYGLTRLRWRGSNFFASTVLVAYLMPAVLMFIPIYQIFSALHLTNNLYGLMVAYPTFALPFATWLLMGYYASIPREMEEAALIDGCNYFQAFFRVVLPLAAPALMAAALFSITLAWKEFIFAFVFLSKERLYTLSVGLAQMIIGDVLPWGELMAAALLMAIPVVTIYVIGNRFMVAGLTAGAVKG
ncbi:MAG: ABC transporter permease subunit [Caldilineaceae bacterium]|nr:ABC transporter permease subunit [Caldilineaceae bacterium]